MAHAHDPHVSTGYISLVVGCFHLPHRGHLPLLWAAAASCDIVVGIESAERHGTWKDPLTFEERAACLRAVLGAQMRPVVLNDIGSTLAPPTGPITCSAALPRWGCPCPH